MNIHEQYMHRCLQLAESGLGSVAPNPLVGSVIVHEGRIIGEGYHQRFGEAHAEVMAVRSVKDEQLLCDATLYVNLEPCAHHGKTPPCADLIVEKRIPRVVIANIDTYAEVAGKGIQRLREAGVEVTTGVLENEGHFLNRRFFTFHEHKRAYIILKWAQTADGFLDHIRTAGDDSHPLRISGEASSRLVHRWRSEEAAILVGRNTAMLDDPKLTTRMWPGDDPLRLVIDPRLQVSKEKHLLSDGKPTWVFNALQEYCEGPICYTRIHDPEHFALEIVRYLYEQGIQSVIVEGGASTLKHFIDADLWDEVRIISGRQRIGEGVNAPDFRAQPSRAQLVGEDLLQFYFRT